jgi:glycosyltransferase involved in cell wall biosynthesis
VRIAVDVTPLLGAPTGVHQSVRGLLDGLAAAEPRLDVDPYVLSARARGVAPAGVRTARSLPLPAGLAIRAWGRSDRPRADRWLGGADVVHGTNFVVPPMRSTPTTVTVHDCWCAREPARCRPEVAAFTAAVRRAVARGAWLHVTTDHGAAEVADVYGATERVAVVPFGVPTSLVARAAPGEVPAPVAGRAYVLALGALDPRKGLTGLVRAFGAVAGRRADARLVLAGPDGPDRPAVEAAVAALPPDRRARVHLLGTVDDATRLALLRGAAVLAYPSLDEGFGFPVLEAMAAGVAVVASTAGALPEVTGGAARLVPVGDDDALSAALAELLGDDAARTALAAAGTAQAATFTWERTAAGLAALWRRAASAGP